MREDEKSGGLKFLSLSEGAREPDSRGHRPLFSQQASSRKKMELAVGRRGYFVQGPVSASHVRPKGENKEIQGLGRERAVPSATMRYPRRAGVLGPMQRHLAVMRATVSSAY